MTIHLGRQRGKISLPDIQQLIDQYPFWSYKYKPWKDLTVKNLYATINYGLQFEKYMIAERLTCQPRGCGQCQAIMVNRDLEYRKVSSSRLSRLVAHLRIFRLLMYCDLWPKEFKIEQQTGLLLATLQYASTYARMQSRCFRIQTLGTIPSLFPSIPS